MNTDDFPSSLSPQDREALDWLMERGVGAEGAPADLAPRVERIEAILTSAGSVDIEPGDELAHAVLAAVASQSGRLDLGEADQDALDALVMAQMDSARVPGALRERAEKLSALGALLEQETPAHDPALTDRVMAAVESCTVSQDIERPVLARIGGRVADLVSIAAVLLIGASVVWPVMTTYRDNAIRQSNQANLAVAGIGFGSYAADYQGALPRVEDREAQQKWWRVQSSEPTSNAANLFALARLQYTPEAALQSPGNPDAPRTPLPAGAMDWESIDQVSYSYALPVGPRDMHAGPVVVLADRSPVVRAILADRPVGLSENSPNHGGRGQHMLQGDGSVLWTTEPYTAYGDHIYLPRGIERQIHEARRKLRMRIERLPAPSDRADVFLGP